MGGGSGRVVSINVSPEKRVAKRPVGECRLRPEVGIPGDAHSGPGSRQLSLLAIESINKQQEVFDGWPPAGEGITYSCPKAHVSGGALKPGSCSENITTEGIDLAGLPVGTKVRVGSGAVLEVTDRGKQCYLWCRVFKKLGACRLAGEAVFARVLREGTVRVGDPMETVMEIAVLTVSDRSYSGERRDESGPALAEAARQFGGNVSHVAVVPDERERIEEALRQWADGGQVDVILTTGGTGVAPRDVTPEATAAVIEKRVPGLVEAMRSESVKVTPHAMLSRSEAGIRGKCLIVNLPGSPTGAVECFQIVAPALRHAVDLLQGRKVH